MNKRPRKAKAQPFGSNQGLRHTDQMRTAASASPGKVVSYKQNTQISRITEELSALPKKSLNTRIFIGPSVEGADVEYVEIVSGKVSTRKPSFVR